MNNIAKIAHKNVRSTRIQAGKFSPKIVGRAFDAVAYAAALEVLG
jgi:hypothetical protein